MKSGTTSKSTSFSDEAFSTTSFTVSAKSTFVFGIMSEARLANFSSLVEITDNTSGFSSNSFNCIVRNYFVSDCTYFFLSNSAKANGD